MTTLCELCFRKSVAHADVGPLCRTHKRAYDDGADFDGCVTRTMHNQMDAIYSDPVARYLLKENQVRDCMTSHGVVNTYGDPREWPVYRELTAQGFVPPPEKPRPRASGTHEHWAIHQKHWTGEWYIQRAVRQGLGTAYDPPLPGHSGFKTKKEAIEFRRTLS